MPGNVLGCSYVDCRLHLPFRSIGRYNRVCEQVIAAISGFPEWWRKVRTRQDTVVDNVHRLSIVKPGIVPQKTNRRFRHIGKGEKVR